MPERSYWSIAEQDYGWLFKGFPFEFIKWLRATYPNGIGDLGTPYAAQRLKDIYSRYTPTTGATAAPVAEVVGGVGGNQMIAPDVIQTATGFETSDGLPLSKDLATKIFNDYWNPKSKTPQVEPTQYRTKTSNELEAMESENLRMRNAQVWEEARANAAKSLTGGPRDWINAWQLNQQRNPWMPAPQTQGSKWESSLRQSRDWLQTKEPLYTAYKAALSAGVFDETGIENLTQKAKIETFISSFNDRKKQADATEGLLKAEFGTQASEPRSWGEAGNMTIGAGDVGGAPPAPTTPPTPSWLKQMYPQLGANISKVPIAPLSGQQWLAMPESQRQGWQGFAEYSGAIPMDLESQRLMMQTETPMGAGRTSWRPAKQRGSF